MPWYLMLSLLYRVSRHYQWFVAGVDAALIIKINYSDSIIRDLHSAQKAGVGN